MDALNMPADATALTHIDANAARNPSHPAILFYDQVVTYGELVAASRRMARALMNRGVKPGDHVCLLAPNSPHYYAAYLATLRCGATFFPINTELSVEEVAYIIANSRPALMLTAETLRAKVEAARAAGVHVGADLSLETLKAEADAQPVEGPFTIRGPADVAVVIHTSGTTAQPKGVVATDRMEVLSASALQERWAITPGDISVCALPLSYTFGLFSASFVALSAGATILLFPKFNPVRVLEGIVRHRATYMVGVPTMYAMMLEHVRQTGRRYDLASVRMMAASGAPITLQTKEDFHAALGVRLRDYYALSECTPIFSFDLSTGQGIPPLGSVGTLVPGAEVKIIDDQGQPAAPGVAGELLVRSDRLMPGYYEDPERTAAAFDGAWFRTRDFAYSDADGHYFIVGRDRDQVISGGHKIASTEVESLIARLPQVAQVAVVGAPHEVLGEQVKAVIVLKPGQQLTADAVTGFCEQHLATYKIPRQVEFRADLPISPAGKVLKRQLI